MQSPSIIYSLLSFLLLLTTAQASSPILKHVLPTFKDEEVTSPQSEQSKPSPTLPPLCWDDDDFYWDTMLINFDFSLLRNAKYVPKMPCLDNQIGKVYKFQEFLGSLASPLLSFRLPFFWCPFGPLFLRDPFFSPTFFEPRRTPFFARPSNTTQTSQVEDLTVSFGE